MSPYTRKLVIAFAASLSGIALSFLWFQWDLARSANHDESAKKLVAHLLSAKNEVQKRAAKRVIWQRVDEDEPLFSGEAVRTSSDAEAKISFESGAEVDLDPDSVVIIEDTGNKINLDFVKGNLFVKGGDPRGENLSLKSGNTDISLNNADVALNKSANGKGVDVQVLRGTAQLNNGDKNVTLDKDKSGTIGDKGVDVTQQFFKIKAPLSNNKLYVRVDKKEPVIFSFAPISNEYEITLEAGARRDILQKAGTSVDGSKGEISAQLKVGAQFWRLKATNKKDPKQVVYSLVNKVTVLAEVPPKLLSPARDVVTGLSPQTRTLSLRWMNPSQLVKLQLEISRDPKFGKDVIAEVVEDTGVHDVPLTEDGEYYWRLSGFRAGSVNQLVSDSQKFILRINSLLVPPELKLPAAEARISFENVENGGVFLVWTPVLGVSKYHLVVESVGHLDPAASLPPPLVDKEVNDITQIRLPSAKPGQYRWTVTSVDAEGKTSKPSAPRSFIVEELPSIQWTDNRDQENYFYLTENPSLKVAWQPLARLGDKVVRYKVTVRPQLEGPVNFLETTGLQQISEVPADGLYHVSVEALNEKGVSIGRSHVRDVSVQIKPLLPAPQFSARVPAQVQALKNGSAPLSWEPVVGAKSYVVNIKTESGQVSKSEKFTSQGGVLKNLLPGQYRISLASVDDHGRVGPDGEEKILMVPRTSDLRAPGLKRLMIK